MTKDTKTDEGWIGVDLDGTLARYDGWVGPTFVGAPIPLMRDRVLTWLSEGREVRIFTARVSPVSCRLNGQTVEEAKKPIEHWCKKYLFKILPITHEKDMRMTELWDDRAVQVIPNTGMRLDGKH